MTARLGGTFDSVDSGAYTDLNRLNNLKNGADRDGEGNVRKVAQEFESVFLNQMLKSMRSANEVLAQDSPFNSQTTKQFQDMYDQQLSVNLAKNGGGIGLADMMTRSMLKDAGKTPSTEVAATKTATPATAATAQSGTGIAMDMRRALWDGKASQAAAVASANGSAGTSERKDVSALLNSRRLAMPSKASAAQSQEALLAAAANTANATGNSATAANATNWKAVQQLGKSAVASVSGSAQLNGGGAVSLGQTTGKSVFRSRQEFVDAMLPMAQEAAKKIGVDAHYLVAQAALETGWGKSIIRERDGSTSNNLFGIKAHSSWDGDVATTLTTEYRNGKASKEAADFRSYDSFKQSFDDYVSFLQSNDRYGKALAKGGDSSQFMHELQRAGYASDPQYARKVTQIARQMKSTYENIAAVDTSVKRT
ncbi:MULTISPECIES: flagellar assembly peptidoglycan hydrolase FlgJ [unclassified Pseudomonas]|uniref:flagellar assembly peptidoglycan hydrolase FlgJ n=1 Tax=unclassified Pseudomonas TaxID=196821 RepID=UPI00235F5EC2|nr:MULTISPECIES: flagellar assembly peptidoglycan hydrolase FlgJ [unclassified Pseudomonas]